VAFLTVTLICQVAVKTHQIVTQGAVLSVPKFESKLKKYYHEIIQ